MSILPKDKNQIIKNKNYKIVENVKIKMENEIILKNRLWKYILKFIVFTCEICLPSHVSDIWDVIGSDVIGDKYLLRLVSLQNGDFSPKNFLYAQRQKPKCLAGSRQMNLVSEKCPHAIGE